MGQTTILELMIADHGKIMKLLRDVEKSIGMELISTMKVFDTFEWELEKHIFIEEKAIFSSYSPTNIVEGYKMVPELVQQHNEILNRLRMMRKNLQWQRPIDYDEFKELITTHKTFEETSLYPKLDQQLDGSQKEEIMRKIREVVSFH
jgi:iron-sulfur cluster repair protein YtfE (RIC family)